MGQASSEPTQEELRRDLLKRQIEEYTIRIETTTDSTTLSSLLFRRGDAKIRLGLYEESLQDLDDAIAKNDSNEEYWYARGYVKYMLLQFDQAIVDFDQALLCKNDREFLFMRAICKKNLVLYEESLHDLDAAIAISEREPEYLIKYVLFLYSDTRSRALVRIKQSMLSQALEDVQKSSQYSTSPLIPQLLGIIKLDLGKYKQALKHFDEALSKTQNTFIDAFTKRGYCLVKLGQHVEAIRNFGSAVHICKKLELSRILIIEPLIFAAFSMREIGHMERSVETFQEALGIVNEYQLKNDPPAFTNGKYHFNDANVSDIDLLCLKANCLYGLRRYDIALEIMNDVISRESRSWRHYLLRGNILAAFNMIPKAQIDYVTSYTLNNQSVEPIAELARTKLKLGDAQQALECMNQVTSSIEYLHFHFIRASVLEALGEVEQADAELQHVLNVSPTHFRAKQARARLEERTSLNQLSLLLPSSELLIKPT
jgi:tetratricopeptide (TPR) repeat protein